MPYYQFLIPAGGRTLECRAEVAAAFTRVHVEVTGAPAGYVNCSFVETAPGSIFVGQRAVEQARMVGLIRSGRSAELKRELITRLVEAWSQVTGEPAADYGLWIYELPGAQMWEAGGLLREASQDPGART